MKKIILTVTNDLVTDQRVHKISTTLSHAGYNVLLVGRKIGKSKNLKTRIYKTKRIGLIFKKGFLFYAEYNIRIFFFLLFHPFDIVVANDLDTLPCGYFASKLKSKKIIYDSHEYFTEVPELVNRKFVRNIWLSIEKTILPNVKKSYTVCDSIANIYREKYSIDMKVIRNVPVKNQEVFEITNFKVTEFFKKAQSQSKKIIIYQGALNVNRGIETVIDAMKFIDNAIFFVVGEGDISEELQKYSKERNVEEKVIFTGKIAFEELCFFTKQAHAGISLEENTGLNYYYALPNKLFDYIHAKVPMLVSDLPEMKRIVTDYNVGLVANNRNPENIAKYLNDLLFNEPKREQWIANMEKAINELCWENEEKKLIGIYENGMKIC